MGEVFREATSGQRGASSTAHTPRDSTAPTASTSSAAASAHTDAERADGQKQPKLQTTTATQSSDTRMLLKDELQCSDDDQLTDAAQQAADVSSLQV